MSAPAWSRWVVGLVLAAAPASLGAQGMCGDCDGNGTLSILDALSIARIGVGLETPSVAGLCTCDSDASGSIGIVDALLVAQRSVALPSLLECGPACPPPYRILGCGASDLDNPSITSDDPGGVAAFALPGTTAYYALRPPPPDTEIDLRLDGLLPTTDLDLYVGLPGVPPATADSAVYIAVQSLGAGSAETVRLDCDFLARSVGFPIAIAVHSVVAGGTFDLSATCVARTCPQRHDVLLCGETVAGAFSAVQTCPGCPPVWPPDLSAGPASVAFFSLPLVQPAIERIEIQLDFPTGDLDLLAGNPGVAPAETDPSAYGFISAILRPERLVIDAASTPPISAYHGLPLALAVTAYSGTPPLDFQLTLTCTSAAGVEVLGCGAAQSGIGTITAGTGGGASDLRVPGTTQFYSLIPVPADITAVEIRVSDMIPGTDLDLFVGAPGTVPGDDDLGHYPYRSENPGSADEVVTLTCAELYLLSGGELAFAVHGRTPGAFDVSVTCTQPPCPCATSGGAGLDAGCLGAAGVEDRFTFYAAAGELISVRVDTFDAATTFDPRAALFAPGLPVPLLTVDGGLGCRAAPVSGECPTFSWNAISDGVYSVAVASSGALGATMIGNYVVQVTVSGTPATLVQSADDAPVSW